MGDVKDTHLKKHKSVAKTTRKVEHTNFMVTTKYLGGHHEDYATANILVSVTSYMQHIHN